VANASSGIHAASASLAASPLFAKSLATSSPRAIATTPRGEATLLRPGAERWAAGRTKFIVEQALERCALTQGTPTKETTTELDMAGNEWNLADLASEVDLDELGMGT